MTVRDAALNWIAALADDVGRLRPFTCADTYPGFLAGRIATHVEVLDAMLRPSAAARYRALREFGFAEDAAVREALAAADDDVAELRRRLRVPEEQTA